MKPKRPRDANQMAKSIIELATGQTTELVLNEKKQAAGRIGAKRRSAVLTPEKRSEIAMKAAKARWKRQ